MDRIFPPEQIIPGLKVNHDLRVAKHHEAEMSGNNRLDCGARAKMKRREWHESVIPNSGATNVSGISGNNKTMNKANDSRKLKRPVGALLKQSYPPAPSQFSSQLAFGRAHSTYHVLSS
jgi:hypothetical protein